MTAGSEKGDLGGSTTINPVHALPLSSRDKRGELSDSASSLHRALLAFDVVFIILGVLIIAFGGVMMNAGFVHHGQHILAYFGYHDMMTAAGLVLFMGLVVVVVGAFGIFTAKRGNKRLVLSHIVLLALMIILTVVAGALAIHNKRLIAERVRMGMYRSLRDMYGNSGYSPYEEAGPSLNLNTNLLQSDDVTQIWDRLQREYYCCGVMDKAWDIYRGSSWYLGMRDRPGIDKPFVPKSCCVYKGYNYDDLLDRDKCQTWSSGPPHMREGNSNEALHSRGCFPASWELGLSFMEYFGIVSLITGFLFIIGAVVSYLFYNQLD